MPPTRPAAVAAAALATAAALLAAAPAAAMVLRPTGIAVTDPPGGETVDPDAVTDDLRLERLEFGPAVFENGDSFSPVAYFEVLDRRDNINAEWGDDDDARDGDPDPFTKAGLDPALQETTDPEVQDRALLQAFNSLSLSEMSDGEKGGFTFRVLFADGLADDRPGEPDDTPELVFFERGMNDVFQVEPILGGDLDDMVYGAPYELSSAEFGDTGYRIDTTEISASQPLGIGGLDLDVFGLAPDAVVFGLRVSVASDGPDLNGLFLSAEDPGRFTPPLSPVAARGASSTPAPAVPLPPAAAGLLAGLAALAAAARGRTRAARAP